MTSMAELKRRLIALEALPRRDELPPTPEGMVRVGYGLFVPSPIDRPEWAALARAQQSSTTN